MRKSTSTMLVTVTVIWLLLACSGGTTISSTNDETTTSIYDDLELQDEMAAVSAPTEISYDTEEDVTLNPPSLENDTNVNYVKNISENVMAEVEFSTYEPTDVDTTSSPVNIDPVFDTLDESSNFDELSGNLTENIPLAEKEVDKELLTDNVETSTDQIITNSINDSSNRTKSDSFQDDTILDNVIMDRMGLADDYSDDYKGNNDPREKSKISSWKPVWPFSAISSFTSTPRSVIGPRTSIYNDVTSVKPVKYSVNTVSKEPVTAYYFDVTNTPLPAVGPLHNPKDLYGSKVFSTNTNIKESKYYQNLTAQIHNTDSSIDSERQVIESTPVVSLDFVPESSKLANNVYSILNDGFDQNEEEFSVTFSTLLPPIKENIPTKTVEVLQPKLVTEKSRTSTPTFKSGIKSSIMNVNTNNSTHEATTSLNSLPAHVSIAPTTSPSKVSNTKVITPLWVRLSGQSASAINSTKTEPSLLHSSSTITSPHESVMSIATNSREPTIKISENISPTSAHSMKNVTLFNGKNDPKSKTVENTLTIFDSIKSQNFTPIQHFSNDSNPLLSSITNDSSVSHSSSHSMTEISISEKVNDVTTANPAGFDANFNLKTSMKHEHTSVTVPDTPIIIPTQPVGKHSKESTPMPKLGSTTSTAATKKANEDDQPSTVSIVEDNNPIISTVNASKSTAASESEKVETSVDGLLRNPNGVSGESSSISGSSQATTQSNPVTLDSLLQNNHETFDKYHAKTDYPETTKSPQEGDTTEEYEISGADMRHKQLPRFLSTTEEPVLFTATLTGASILDTDYKPDVPADMMLPTTKQPNTTRSPEKNGFSNSVSVNDGNNMIKTVIKHLPGMKEPELKIIEMHSNGTNISEPSPYIKAAVSYGVQEFCRHQGNIRSLLGEWVNNHLDNGTDSTSYEVQFFAQPNCTNITPLPENAANTKTVLYFYVMDHGLINTNITRQYPKNPTNLEISQRLAYLKEKILHLELVNAITSSEDLALEEAAVGTSIIAIIISTIILFFLVISAALAFIIVKRRRANDQAHGRRCTPAANDTYSMDSVSVFYHSFRRKNKKRASSKSIRSYQNQGFDDPNGPSRPLNFSKLTHFISDTEGIYDEFLKIPSVTPKYDEMPKGVEDKNRYANVIPVPETRVYLKKNAQTPVDEYINANFIHGARGEAKYYIAAQAPLDETVPDFWQMIWEEETKVIVMLTDFVEKGIDKCADYLPPSETLDCHRVYGDFQVTLKSRDMREKYIVSQVQLKNLENNLVREIAHMWFTGWPYSGIPNEEKSYISYIFETRAMRKKLRSKGPILVHCSPGTGRSGTFIACDISMRNFGDQKSVDIPKAVWKLRRERAGAVQTKEQYAFIYRVTNLYAAKLMTGNLDLF